MVDARDYHDADQVEQDVFIAWDTDIKNSTRRLMIYTEEETSKMHCVCYQSPETKEQNFVTESAM